MKQTQHSHTKKRNHKINLLNLFAIGYIFITIWFYISIMKMNLLPASYITLFTIIEIVLTIAIVIGLVKHHKTNKLNIFCLVLVVLISCAYLYISNYANATTNFLASVFNEIEETEDYYLIVRKDSPYEKIEDIAQKEVYFYQVEDSIKSEIETKSAATLKQQESLIQIGNELLTSNIDIILISSTQHSILSEEIENYQDNTKIIYTATHTLETVSNAVEEDNGYSINHGIFHVYISGIDTSGKISNVSRSDANILVTVNTNTHEILLTSIPRDYYVTLHSKKAKDKLTHSGIYGINETVSTVEDLLGITINYYVRVNFTTVIKLVDVLGGVDVYSDYSFTADGYSFQKGYNHLNGEKALRFSRERHSFASGDNQRVKNQQHVIEAIINKALSGTILTKYANLLSALEGSFQTNIEQDEISELVKEQLANMPAWTIKSNSLQGTGASKTTYSMGNQNLYVMIPNAESVQNAKEQIANIIGE